MEGDLTDEELPGYALSHCETEIGAFHKRHVARLLRMAGRDEEADKIERWVKEWYYLGPGAIRPIVKAIKGYESIVA